MKVDLVQHTPDLIPFLAKIASICYNSDPKNQTGLIKHLYESGHHSVFEHAWFTWRIEGVSRALTHQLVRHRMCSFTQRSQRYCNEDGFEVETPPSIGQTHETSQKYTDCISAIKDCYNDLVLDGIPNEDARFLLPNACYTQLYVSCNLRELMHIANERLCSRAQWEIRKLVRQMCDTVVTITPELSQFLVPKCEAHKVPYCPEKKSCGRHGTLSQLLDEAREQGWDDRDKAEAENA